MAYNNYGFNQNYGGGYPMPPQQTPGIQYGQQPQQTPPGTNKIYVVSAEDAMSRYAQPNTVMFYIQQDETVVYEVYTDMQGKKAIRARQLVDAPVEKKQPEQVTRQEFDALRATVERLINPQKEVTENV